ncbi:MAG: NAD(P)/FAD-dependent oxidoreductase, partial [Halieaceae bacterium]
MSSNHSADYDVIAVGAGFAGISLSYHLREAGFNVKVFDRASDVGGTWAWNKYPGAATDSESYYYCLTFSKEVLQEWSWSKRYSGWEETQNYLKFVMDKFSLWPMFQLSTEVESAEFDNETGLWNVRTQGGETHTAKYFVSAMGMISQPVLPNISGQDRFNGHIFHSSRWPEGLDVAGKRVGIIGAGATTVQMLPEVAKTAAQVTVFQRTPNFVLPAMQKDMTPEWEKEIKDNYDEIIAKARNHMFGMAFEQPPGRNAVDTPPEEVQRIFEEHWNGSFRWVFETFDDLLGSAEANQMASDFITSKIKEKVNDPELAELLTPKGYPLFAKRPPLDHGYY